MALSLLYISDCYFRLMTPSSFCKTSSFFKVGANPLPVLLITLRYYFLGISLFTYSCTPTLAVPQPHWVFQYIYPSTLYCYYLCTSLFSLLTVPCVSSMAQANNHSFKPFNILYIISKQLNISREKSQNHIVKAYFKVMTTSPQRTRTVRSFYATLLVNSLSHSSRTLFHTFFSFMASAPLSSQTWQSE